MALSKHWHSIATDILIKEFQSDEKRGLNSNIVETLRTHYGENILTQKKAESKLSLFLQQFNQPLVYILLIAAIITALLQEFVDSSVIFGVILINAIIGYMQEIKAKAAIEALANMGKVVATVFRDGEKISLDAKELVVGDIVILYSGERVPADLRILHSKELNCDESSLTGESVSVEKSATVLDESTSLADRENMLYSSSLITTGNAIGIVVAVGNSTQIGKINTMISQANILQTPLTIKIAKFSKTLLYIIMIMAIFTFVVGVIKGGETVEMFMAAVALAVAAIPEGLPAAMTIILAIGVSRMAKQNAIIRKLPAVETLGSTTVICSDKTGTLTQNEMTVKAVFAGNSLYEVEGIGYGSSGKITQNALHQIDTSHVEDIKQNRAAYETLKAGILCNSSKIILENSKHKVIGDPTEAALIVSAKKANLEKDILEKNLIHIDTLDFESENQYMATYYGSKNDKSSHIYIKGSLEKILQRCEVMLDSSGNKIDIDKELIIQEAEHLARDGMRILAFAYMNMDIWSDSLKHHHIASGLTFLGIQGMIDPPRSGVKESIADCHKAGIKVKMITGDHKITALAIAKEVGIKTDSEFDSLSGLELQEMSDDELLKIVEDVNVFARVTPEQKLRLVKLLQQKNNIVSMTGDGVNDAPALKQANIGIAMGITGTEVAKESADMILTDDNFTTIKNAVEEGRGVYTNIIKFITWVLPTNVGEGLIVLFAITFGFALPLSALQILWVNMTTAIFLGLALAFEPNEKNLMNYPPIEPDTPVLSKKLMIRIFYVGGLLMIFSFMVFWYVKNIMGLSLEEARTAAVNVLVFGELFYLLNCRSLKSSMFSIGVFSSSWLLLGVGLMIFSQLIFTYASFMNRLFSTAPIGLTEWGLIIVSGITIYFIVEFEKKLL